MTDRIGRRSFVKALVGTAVVAGAAGCSRGPRAVFEPAGSVASVGPYGPLGPPDTNGISLPSGFSSRLLAVSGDVVPGSSTVWHDAPDGGGCFPVPDGGWVYVSNSEVGDGGGGVGALRFSATGDVVDAYRILSGTSRNCAGGHTVRGTWLSCEENGSQGLVHECDPTAAGQGVVRPLLGSFNHEAAVEDPVGRAVYLTEDDPQGRLYRFVPSVPGDLSAGRLYAASVRDGSVSWILTSSTEPDRRPSTTPFDGGEGLWIDGRTLLVTTKGDRRVWELDLDAQRLSVLYDAALTPDAALDAVDNCTVHATSGDAYVCEDGGNMEVCIIAAAAGGAAREVAAFLRIDGHDGSEWTGVAFSPDQSRMYVSSQRGSDGRGRTYEITGPFRSADRTSG